MRLGGVGARREGKVKPAAALDSVCVCVCVCVFVLDFIYLFLDREEGREKERERSVDVWLPLLCPSLGTWPATQACALTGIRTSDP